MRAYITIDGITYRIYTEPVYNKKTDKLIDEGVIHRGIPAEKLENAITKAIDTETEIQLESKATIDIDGELEITVKEKN